MRCGHIGSDRPQRETDGAFAKLELQPAAVLVMPRHGRADLPRERMAERDLMPKVRALAHDQIGAGGGNLLQRPASDCSPSRITHMLSTR